MVNFILISQHILAHCYYNILHSAFECLYKGKVHPCTGTEALYRPYGP